MNERLKTLQAKPLSTYHSGVVNDFIRAYNKWGRLSTRQEAFLRSIEEQYNPEAIEKRVQQLKRLQTDEQYRSDVRTVCNYYLSTGYYRNTATNVLDFLKSGDTKSAPKPEALTKMMENKYAQNILASHRSEPKFEVGDLVQLRANVSWDNMQGNRLTLASSANAKAFMVVEVGSRPISRPLTYDEKRGGTRWYKLLVMGSTDTMEVIEKELKRPTKKAMGKK